jgi:murein L,D-transpeptidase YcbB/YkuD
MSKTQTQIAEAEVQASPGDSPEVAELKKQLAAVKDKMLWADLPTTPEFEQLVAAKMRAGLKREDAMVCARRQELTDAVAAERDAVVKTAAAKVEKEFEGKDKRSPEYKEAKADAISQAVAAGKFHEKFVAAGSHQLNPGVSATATN